jgi:hypothetical protein
MFIADVLQAYCVRVGYYFWAAFPSKKNKRTNEAYMITILSLCLYAPLSTSDQESDFYEISYYHYAIGSQPRPRTLSISYVI